MLIVSMIVGTIEPKSKEKIIGSIKSMKSVGKIEIAEI